VAAGLALIFGLRRVVNFAHGSLAVVVLAAMGAALDLAVFRPLQKEDPLTCPNRDLI